jgi:hypothetical protein
MIKLTELIQMSGVALGDYKIHCATGHPNPPLEAFFDGKFKGWQEHQTQKNFERDKVLSLIQLEGDRWLFAGVYKVLGLEKKKGKKPYFIYDTKEIGGLEHLTGKAIVNFNKTFRASYLRGEKYGDKLVVCELREQRMTVGEFPNYNAVAISFRKLGIIVRERNPSWKAALANVSGVYLITDTSDGRLYVGGAYGGQGLWQRWSEYVETGHGGNKELKILLKSKGKTHRQFLQISILETCDLRADTETVIARESHWKKVLTSREHGLNSN